MHTLNKPFGKNYQSLFLVLASINCALAGLSVYRGIQIGDPRPVLGWLLGFGFWFSIVVGMVFIVLLGYVFGAKWSVIVRRQLEHWLSATKWLFVCLAPLVLIPWISKSYKGILWKWTDPHAVLYSGETVTKDTIYLSKQAYLNLPFFSLRVLIYAFIFSVLVNRLRTYSFNMDRDPQMKWLHRAGKTAAVGLPMIALTTTFAAFDLFMSISYHWFSTMYGVCFFATSMRSGLAVTILLCSFLTHKGYLKNIYTQGHRYDLACLSLTFTIFWAYVAFSQYFLIYQANIPEETFWYHIRELDFDGLRNSWWYVGTYGLVFGYFGIPFLYLLSYKNKVTNIRLNLIAIWILAFNILDFYYNIMPIQLPSQQYPEGYIVLPFNIRLVDIEALVGIGSLCIWAFLRSLATAKAIPIHDPFIQESLDHHE